MLQRGSACQRDVGRECRHILSRLAAFQRCLGIVDAPWRRGHAAEDERDVRHSPVVQLIPKRQADDGEVAGRTLAGLEVGSHATQAARAGL